MTTSGFDAGSVAVISVGGLNCCAIDSKGKRIDLNDSCGPAEGAPAPLSRRLIAPLRRLGTPRVDVEQVVWAGAIEYRLLL